MKSAKAQSSHYHPPHHTHTPKTALSRTRTFLLWWRKWSRRWRSTCGSSFLRPQTRNREESGEGEGACIVATNFFGAEYMCSLRVKAKAEDRSRWTTLQPHRRRNKGTDVRTRKKKAIKTIRICLPGYYPTNSLGGSFAFLFSLSFKSLPHAH